MTRSLGWVCPGMASPTLWTIGRIIIAPTYGRDREGIGIYICINIQEVG